MLIINIQHFTVLNLETRHGSEIDVDRLEDSFGQKRYEIHKAENLEAGVRQLHFIGMTCYNYLNLN